MESYSKRRNGSDLGLVPPDKRFVADVNELKDQLYNNYAIGNTACEHNNMHNKNDKNGLGSTLHYVSMYIAQAFQRGVIFTNVDEMSTVWFREDMTRECETIFGDCYLPALRTTRNASTVTGTSRCHNGNWFVEIWGRELYFAAVLSWTMGHNQTRTGLSALAMRVGIDKLPAERCICLNVRRGDACVHPSRGCFSNDQYWEATESLRREYGIGELAVMTDADDIQVERYQQAFHHIYYTAFNRSKYNVMSMNGSSYEEYATGFRAGLDRSSAASEFLREIAQGGMCHAMVGTMTSGVSRILFSLMLVEHGRIPPFVFLEGCPVQLVKGWAYPSCDL
jgi:hypothetical protein